MSISALDTNASETIRGSHHGPNEKKGLQNTPPAPSRAKRQTPKSSLPMGKFGQTRRMKSISRRIKHRSKRLAALARWEEERLAGKLKKKKRGGHPNNGVHRMVMRRHSRVGTTVGGSRR